MGKGENLGIFSFSHYVFKGKNITFIQFHNINFASNKVWIVQMMLTYISVYIHSLNSKHHFQSLFVLVWETRSRLCMVKGEVSIWLPLVMVINVNPSLTI